MSPLMDTPKILLITDDAAEESHTAHILAKYHFTNLLVNLRRSADAMKFFLAFGSDTDSSRTLPELIIMGMRDSGRINLTLAQESRKGVLSGIPLILVVESREDEEEIRNLKLPCTTFITRPIGFFKLLEGMQKLGMRWIVLRPGPKGS